MAKYGFGTPPSANRWASLPDTPTAYWAWPFQRIKRNSGPAPRTARCANGACRDAGSLRFALANERENVNPSRTTFERPKSYQISKNDHEKDLRSRAKSGYWHNCQPTHASAFSKENR